MINSEIPTFEKINSLEDFSMLYSEPARTKVAEFLSSYAEIFNLSRLKDHNKEAYFETIKSVTDLIAEDHLTGEELENLVKSFEFDPEESTSEVCRWNNDFTITLNNKLFKKSKEGKFFYNINHDICHEIGHSVIELADDAQIEFPDEIYDVLERIDIKYESQYIQECVSNKLDPEVIKKERMAEIFGFYLTSHKDKKEFCLSKILAMADKELVSILELTKDTTYSELKQKADNNPILGDLLTNTLKLYDILSGSWQKIREDINAVDINRYLEEKNEQPEIAEQKDLESISNTPNSTQQLAPEALKTDITNKSTTISKGFSETSNLGQKQERSPGFVNLLGQLISDFSKEVPNVN